MLYFNTNKPHSIFILRNTSCIRKPQVISGEGGGGAHPLHPPEIHPWALTVKNGNDLLRKRNRPRRALNWRVTFPMAVHTTRITFRVGTKSMIRYSVNIGIKTVVEPSHGRMVYSFLTKYLIGIQYNNHCL